MDNEDPTSPIPAGSDVETALKLFRGATLFPNTQAAVEFGTTEDGGFYVIVSGDLQDGELPGALQMTFTDDGKLFDLSMVRHDQDGKLVCSNCSVQGEPLSATSAGWTQDEYGDTCPLCAGVDSVGPDSAGVEAIAEALQIAEENPQPKAPVNSMKQPPRPTVRQVERSNQVPAESPRTRAKLPGLRR